jgi:hypothetical protein
MLGVVLEGAADFVNVDFDRLGMNVSLLPDCLQQLILADD